MRINTSQTVVVSIEPKTASGNPANIDGDAEFTTAYNLGTFERLSPTSARFRPNGGVGAEQIGVTADADLDDGDVRTISGSGVIEIVTPEEEATTFEIVFSDPE